MILRIKGGTIRTIYDERLDLRGLGVQTITRASHVEPDPQGEWTADMVAGPVLGPFPKRSLALAAEIKWLEEHL